ncbi:MAG: cyclopentanone 1,2-monooxygenase, partial [Pseudomonadota bacterium]
GLIGTGASGIQIAQEAAKEAKSLTIFQRTPNLCLPMGQERYSPEDNVRLREHWQASLAVRPQCFGGLDYSFIPTNAFDVPDDERLATYQRLWDLGGFSFWLGHYQDLLTDIDVNNAAYDFWRENVLKRIDDPRLAYKLAPATPPHPFGVKRPSLEQNFYEIFKQDNVELVCIKDTPIEKVTETGIDTSETSYEFDVIALATGFDAHTGGLLDIDIIGSHGRSLKEKWNGGVRSFMGLATSAFPNLLIGYGPQAPTATSIGPASAEYQGEWMVGLLRYLRENAIERFDVETAYEQNWRDTIQEIAGHTLFMKADSWYIGANIPGKPREMLSYPGGLVNYLAELEKCRADGYRGFIFGNA